MFATKQGTFKKQKFPFIPRENNILGKGGNSAQGMFMNELT